MEPAGLCSVEVVGLHPVELYPVELCPVEVAGLELAGLGLAGLWPVELAVPGSAVASLSPWPPAESCGCGLPLPHPSSVLPGGGRQW